MAEKTSIILDGLSSFELGMDSGKAPLLLPRNKLAFATNASVRGSYVTHRPTLRKMTLDFAGDVELQTLVEDMLFQGACYFRADLGTESLMAAIGGRLFQFTPDATTNVTVADRTIPGDPNPPLAPQAWLWQSESWIIWNDGVSNPVFFDGITSTRSNYGGGVTQFAVIFPDPVVVATGVGTPITVNVSVDPTGIIDIGDTIQVCGFCGIPLSLLVTGFTTSSITGTNLNLNASASNVFTYGVGIPLSYAKNGVILATQLPPGRMGCYGLGRNWVSLPDGRSFVASDIVGSSSGTAAYNFRDSVLNITENNYLAGGGVFIVPGNVGDIQAMIFTATLDSSLGQGPLQVFTPNIVFSCNSPVDRLEWQDLSNPILTQSLIANGGLGQNSTVASNGDTLFRAIDGIRSLILARREFATWGNTPISREVSRVISDDAKNLLNYGSSVVYDNRLLMTTRPTQHALGVYHPGLVALNFDPLSDIAGKRPSVWEGLWLGVNAHQWVHGRFAGIDRCFAFCRNLNTDKLEMYELLNDGQAVNDDNGDPVRITWGFETACLFLDVKGKNFLDNCRLMDGEMTLGDVVGTVDYEIYFRSQFSQCWTRWHGASICATPGSRAQNRVDIGFGMPDIEICDPVNNRPVAISEQFQFKFVFTGSCKFYGAIFKASLEAKPEFLKPICEPLCINAPVGDCENCKTLECPVIDDFDLYQLEDRPLPDPGTQFLSEEVSATHECPTGEDLVYAGTLPSWITLDATAHTLTGAAGTYSGATQDEANARAQAALDAFITNSVTLGTLNCVFSCHTDCAGASPTLAGLIWTPASSGTGGTCNFALTGAGINGTFNVSGNASSGSCAVQGTLDTAFCNNTGQAKTIRVTFTFDWSVQAFVTPLTGSSAYIKMPSITTPTFQRTAASGPLPGGGGQGFSGNAQVVVMDVVCPPCSVTPISIGMVGGGTGAPAPGGMSYSMIGGFSVAFV